MAAMKKQIAIVEDEPALRDNYAAALSRHGYLVKTYGNRATAMQAFSTRLPDLRPFDARSPAFAARLLPPPSSPCP